MYLVYDDRRIYPTKKNEKSDKYQGANTSSQRSNCKALTIVYDYYVYLTSEINP